MEDLDESIVLAIDTSALLEDINESVFKDEEEYDPDVPQYDKKNSLLKAMPKNGQKRWGKMILFFFHNLLVHHRQFPLTKAAMLIVEVDGVSNRTVHSGGVNLLQIKGVLWTQSKDDIKDMVFFGTMKN